MSDRMPLTDLRDRVVIPACAVLSVLSGRPGKPRPDAWAGNWQTATEATEHMA